MRKNSCLALVLFVATTGAALAKDLFEDGKPINFTRGYPFEVGTTVGGYPIYKGDGRWVLWEVTDRTVSAANATSQTRLGQVRLDQVEANGEWVATQFVIATTKPLERGSYVLGEPCGGAHMLAVNRARGRDDNCLTIDAKSYPYRGNPTTLFDVLITQTRSGDRRYLMELQINADVLGFRDTAPANWNATEALQASPDRKALVERLKKWASQLQIATETILDYSKPQNVFDGIPSFRSLASPAE